MVEYNGQWTSCVNQHMINSDMRNKKEYLIVEIFILGIVEFYKYIYYL